jgi:alanine racemase
MVRPTRAEVDLDALAHNLAVVRRVAAGARVLAVVKADGYGHGVVPVAARLEEAGVDGFGVALAEEGLELREAGVGAEILVLNGVYGGAHADVLAAGLTPVVYDLATVEAFHHAWGGAPFSVHVKVDTGMSRLGVCVHELARFFDELARFPEVRVSGFMTHLAAADTDDEFTVDQLRKFNAALHEVRAHGHRPRTVHAANTAATFAHPGSRFDLVRPGLALFGYSSVGGAEDLRPVMRLRTEIIALREIAPGTGVGYDRTWRASRPTRVATVPVGYGDGLMRRTSNAGFMLVGGRRCAVVGRVSMDLTTLDVTDVPEARVGDEVVILGDQGDERLGAQDLADAAGTIPYEALTAVSRRVPRFYR